MGVALAILTALPDGNSILSVLVGFNCSGYFMDLNLRFAMIIAIFCS